MLTFNTYNHKRSDLNQNNGSITNITIGGNQGEPIVNWVGPNNYIAGPFNGVNSQDLVNLAPGTYIGTVTDSTSNQDVLTINITETQEVFVGSGCDCVDILGNNISTFSVNSNGLIRAFSDNIGGTEVIMSQGCCENLNGFWSPIGNVCTLNRDFSFTEVTSCDRLFDYKIILNPENDGGAIFDVDEGESCSLTVGFDYLLEWDCTTLNSCIESSETPTNINPTILDVLQGATLTATIEKFNPITNSLETVIEIPALEVIDLEAHLTGNTGWLLTGEERDCTILNNQLISEINDCNLLSNNSILNSEWVSFEGKIIDNDILDLLRNESISLGIKIHSEFCEFNLLIDRIKLTQDCIKVVSNERFINNPPSFNLTRVVDNKKSWVKTEEFQDRNYNLEYRNTCYDVNHGKLVVNSKELEIESSIASAIEKGVTDLVFDDSGSFLDINETFTRNTNIYAFFDTTSLRVTDGIAAFNSLQSWFTTFRLNNPSYEGELFSLPVTTETYVNYATRLNNGTLQEIANSNQNWAPLNTLPPDFDGETDAIMLAFVDEVHSQYHDNTITTGFNDQPRDRFVSDYNAFVNIYPNFNSFRAIVYPVIRNTTGGGAALVLQLLAAIEGVILTPTQLNNIDSGELDLSIITQENPYQNFLLSNNTLMQPLSNFNWSGVYNRTSPAINVFNSDTFGNDLDNLLEGGFNLENTGINDITLNESLECDSGDRKANLLRDMLIDVKSRKVIRSYPVLRLLYDRYLNYEEISGDPLNVLTYEKVMNFVKLLGTQWVDLIEQVVPSTALWKSTNIFGNTIFDANKFKYRDHTLLACNEPISDDVVEHIFIDGGVEIFDTSMDTTITNQNCEMVNNSTTCDRLYGYGFNAGSIFRGNVTISTSNNTTSSGGDTVTINEDI